MKVKNVSKSAVEPNGIRIEADSVVELPETVYKSEQVQELIAFGVLVPVMEPSQTGPVVASQATTDELGAILGDMPGAEVIEPEKLVEALDKVIPQADALIQDATSKTMPEPPKPNVMIPEGEELPPLVKQWLTVPSFQRKAFIFKLSTKNEVSTLLQYEQDPVYKELLQTRLNEL